MTINIQTKAQGQVFAFNETRLEKIVNAKTQGEAERMGLFDKIRDLWRGSPKLTAIRELYNSITDPAAHDSKPVDMLSRFHRLRDFAQPAERDQFKVELKAPNNQGEWGYALKVSGQALYQSPAGMLNALVDNYNPQTEFEQFHQALQTDQLLVHAEKFAKDCQQLSGPVLGGRDINSYARGAVDFVSDDRDVRQHIKANLDNPLYSLENFKGFGSTGDPDSFEAIFESNGERSGLILSNRAPSKGEYRGEVLKQALRGEGGEYRNLGEMLGADFESPSDRHISGLYRPLLANMTKAFNEGSGCELNTEQICEKLLALKNDDPLVANKIFVALNEVKLGQTNLLEILLRDSAPPVDHSSACLAAMMHSLEQPTLDPLDILAQAAALGRSLTQALPDGATEESAMGYVEHDISPLISGLSRRRLENIYEAFIAQPHMINASQPTTAVAIQADAQSPYDPITQPEQDRAYNTDVARKLQPFIWGLNGLTLIFEAVKKSLQADQISRERVLSDESQDQLTKSVAPSSTEMIEKVMLTAVVSDIPVHEAIAQVRGQADALPPAHAVFG